jgi:predicted transcriptional regulator
MNTATLQSVCAALSSSIRIEIIAFVRKQGSATVREIADALFGSPERMMPVRRHLQILHDAELLSREQTDREYTYHLSTGGEVILDAIVQMRDLFDLPYKYQL